MYISSWQKDVGEYILKVVCSTIHGQVDVVNEAVADSITFLSRPNTEGAYWWIVLW